MAWPSFPSDCPPCPELNPAYYHTNGAAQRKANQHELPAAGRKKPPRKACEKVSQVDPEDLKPYRSKSRQVPPSGRSPRARAAGKRCLDTCPSSSRPHELTSCQGNAWVAMFRILGKILGRAQNNTPRSLSNPALVFLPKSETQQDSEFDMDPCFLLGNLEFPRAPPSLAQN